MKKGEYGVVCNNGVQWGAGVGCNIYSVDAVRNKRQDKARIGEGVETDG